MSEHWARKYVGLPYVVGGRSRTGVDCWGLVQVVYREEFGIELPLLPIIAQESVRMIIEGIKEQVSLGDWTESREFDGCVVGLSQRSVIHHVGLFARSAGGSRVLHVLESGVVAEPVSRLERTFPVVRFYRHRLWLT